MFTKNIYNLYLFIYLVKRFLNSIFSYSNSNPSGPMINRLKYIQIRFRFENFDSAMCMTQWSQILGWVNHHFIHQIFSFRIDVFTRERISPACPFKRNQWPAIFFYSDSMVCSFTLWCDAHRGAWLRGVMHTTDFFYFYSNTSVKWKRNLKIFLSDYQGPR